MAKYVMVFNSSGNPITMADTGRVVGAGDWDYVDSESDAGKELLGVSGVIQQDYTSIDEMSNSRVQEVAKQIRELNGDDAQQPPATKPAVEAQDGSSDAQSSATVSNSKSTTKTTKGKG